MKRNCPPDRSAEIAEERLIVEGRLSELYPSSQVTAHKIVITRRGYYVLDLHHVRLDSTVKLHSLEGFVQYSNTLGYHHLKPYQALYLLDTRQLIIYHNELPLSLAEAYNLLLRGKADLTNYSVFCYMNRSAYYCLEPEALGLGILEPNCATPEPSGRVETMIDQIEAHPTEPLIEIDKVHCTYEEILAKLGGFGPRDLALIDQASDENLTVIFDAYKRETYAKNKPRRGKLGRPDYFLIICDDEQLKSPSSAQLVSFESQYGDAARRKLLFALVDSDNTMSFVHFDHLPTADLQLDHNKWPEQISSSKLPEANSL